MNIDYKYLRSQYNWLLEMPDSDEKEGLLNLVEILLSKEESDDVDISMDATCN